MTDHHSAHQPPCLGRRHAIAGALGVGIGVPVLAACGQDDGEAPDRAPDPEGSPAASGSAESRGPLTTTADVPVGGGVVFPDQNVVVTQPAEGEFLGFSATCTHQGCAVSTVEKGLIVCTCHFSRFSIEDGSPQDGPAERPLDEVALQVEGDSISLA